MRNTQNPSHASFLAFQTIPTTLLGTMRNTGRIFEACYEKGSELPADDPRRKFKGRTVFQGNNVRDQDSDHALFAELGSSPASMEAAKLLDAFGSQPGFSKAQADAIQAYIQALFAGVPTWLSLPRNRWPENWRKKTHCHGCMDVAWASFWGKAGAGNLVFFRVKWLRPAMKGSSCVRRVRLLSNRARIGSSSVFCNEWLFMCA